MKTIVLPIAYKAENSSCDFDFVNVNLTKNDIINARWVIGLKDFSNAAPITSIKISIEGDVFPCYENGLAMEHSDYRGGFELLIIGGSAYVYTESKYDSSDYAEFGDFDVYNL